jgi:hypothetical protein
MTLGRDVGKMIGGDTTGRHVFANFLDSSGRVDVLLAAMIGAINECAVSKNLKRGEPPWPT